MLPIRHRLSHGASQSLLHILRCRTTQQTQFHSFSGRSIQCLQSLCMSRTRHISTSAEGNKRRKLTSVSPSRTQSSAKMAPMRIQEVEEHASPPTTLELTPVEDTLRRLLLDVAAYIDASPVADSGSQVALPEELARQKTILRFTGGWVRDKLLGVPSHDIDVGINKMTGEQFGYRMKEYLEIPGNPEKYGLEGVATSDKQSQKASASDKSKIVGGLHKIEANPEKSKHLETVTTRILGLDIDLVNLRKESYTDDSRNPQIEFGTAEEDAMRRDATVNAMFYNINTSEIEDFTGQGHDDMRKKLIRTPLEPYQTFKDDPLRVLRLIRFASRLDYQIDPEALAAMRDDRIKDALRRKISRERVGTELEKALHGPDPHEALRLVFDLDLYFTIFSDPTTTTEPYQPDTANWQTMLECVEDTISNDDPIASLLMRDEEERFMAWQLAALVPYRDAPQPPPSAPGRKPPPPIAASVAREGIKSTNKVCDIVVASLRNQHEISGLVDRLYEQKRRPDRPVEGEDPSARDVLGMSIRRWGASWRSQVVYSFLVDVVDSISTNENAVTGMAGLASSLQERDTDEILTATSRKYTNFVTQLQTLELLDADTFKPLIDGKALASALGTKTGPWMKDALDTVMAWQLRNPGATDPSEAIEAVRQARGELSQTLAKHFLKLTIRPLFQKTKPSNVTDAGRKVTTTVLPKRIGDEESEDVTKPWKSEKDNLSLGLLAWTIRTLDKHSIEKVWPLIIPPVLTLVDDWETKYKSLGASLLTQILAATPPSLLQRTGLGEVFEQALIPCLTYLPPLTPTEECVKLLDAAYPALLQLANVRYPLDAAGAATTKMSSGLLPSSRLRNKALDTLIHQGIFHSYTHASQYPGLLFCLYTHLSSILDTMGLESVKHLNSLIPMLNEVLNNRTLANAPEHHDVLIAAAQAMQAVLRNAWPRINIRRLEVVKGVIGCWLNLESIPKTASGGSTKAVTEELKKVIDTVQRIAESEDAERERWTDEKAKLIETEESLRGLLVP